jgi:hypothetical protein
MKKSILSLICAISCLSGWSFTITVTNTNDSGPGSLRQAIADASNGDNINFAVTGVIVVNSYLDISKDIHILGPGANLLAIDGGGTTQIFKDGNYTLNPIEISGLEIRNGKTASYGGAIHGLGFNLTIRNCDIHHNTLTASYGGAIAVWSAGASLTIENSSLHDNSASGYGGCLYLQEGASLTITNSTLYHNSGSFAGQAIYTNGATVSLTNVTIAGHTSGSTAITLNDDFGNSIPSNITIRNCIIDNPISNYAFSSSFGGTQTSQGYNISDDNSMNSFLNNFGDLNNISAQLDPAGLQGNGGITPTVRPFCYSPAINAGTNVFMQDQNGQPISGGIRDIGAYETNYPAPPTVVAHSGAPGICEGDGVILWGSGAATYSWDNGVVDNVPFSPSITNTYHVTGTDVNGCTGTDNITITIELTTGYTAGPDMDVCRSTPMVSLNAYSASGNTFIWSTLGSGSLTNPAAQATDYYLSGADAISDSVALVFETIYTYCANHVDTVVLHLKDPATVNAGGDLNGCANEPNNITIAGGATNAASVFWSSANNGTFTSATTLLTFYTASAMDITLGTATLYLDVNPPSPACPAVRDTMEILFHTPPTFSLGADYTICETDSIPLQTTITGGTLPFIYNWSNGSTTISTANNEMYMPTATENISLLVNDMYGCYGKDTVQVTVDASETLTGTMHVGAGVLTDGVLYMLKFIPQQTIFDTLFTLPFSGGSGTFTFSSFPHGDYLIKIFPDTNLFPNLLPTYYGDAFQWDSAIVINHNCSNTFTADINMIQLLGGTGSGSISGYVLEDVGFGSRLGHGNDHIMVPGGPLKGIDVKLGKNPGGGIQARTMTDTTGHYTFEDLPNDSYRIYVDIPGLPMDSFYVVTINTASDTAINLNYYADSNSVFPILPTAVGLPSHYYLAAGMDVYPNPAKDYTSLRFEADDQSTATIRLLDITGKTVLSTQLRNLPEGKHEYQLNFGDRGLKSGIYFIEVQSGGGSQVKKLVIE